VTPSTDSRQTATDVEAARDPVGDATDERDPGKRYGKAPTGEAEETEKARYIRIFGSMGPRRGTGDGEMTDDDHYDYVAKGSVYASAAATAPRRSLRRKQAVAGVTGALALLTGTYFLTTRLMETSQDSLPEPAALAPLTTAARPAIDGTGISAVPGNLKAPRTTHPAQAAKRTPLPTPSDLAPRVGTPSGTAEERPAGSVTRRVETVRNGTVRISSARFDLTGQSDLRYAADEGDAAGYGVYCTNRVRFDADEPVVEKAGLLLCWRTSDVRSVVTMAVAVQGTPDRQDSVGIIEQEWAALG
jgi:hypothetical protein